MEGEGIEDGCWKQPAAIATGADRSCEYSSEVVISTQFDSGAVLQDVTRQRLVYPPRGDEEG